MLRERPVVLPPLVVPPPVLPERRARDEDDELSVDNRFDEATAKFSQKMHENFKKLMGIGKRSDALDEWSTHGSEGGLVSLSLSKTRPPARTGTCTVAAETPDRARTDIDGRAQPLARLRGALAARSASIRFFDAAHEQMRQAARSCPRAGQCSRPK